MTEELETVNDQDIADFDAICRSKERELRVFQKAAGASRYISALRQRRAELEKTIGSMKDRRDDLALDIDRVEEKIADVRKEAAKILADAKSDADEITVSAKKEAHKLIADANSKADSIISSAYSDIEKAQKDAGDRLQIILDTIKSHKDDHEKAVAGAKELATVESMISEKREELALIQNALNSIRK